MVEVSETEIKEAGKVIAYILEMHLSINQSDELNNEFGEMVDIIVNWSAEREEMGVGVAIAAIAPKSLHEDILCNVISLVSEFEPLRQFFQRVNGASFYLGESEDDDLIEFNITCSGEVTNGED